MTVLVLNALAFNLVKLVPPTTSYKILYVSQIVVRAYMVIQIHKHVKSAKLMLLITPVYQPVLMVTLVKIRLASLVPALVKHVVHLINV